MNTPTENYLHSLARLYKQALASRFVRWWLGELAAIVPAALRPAGLATESLTVVRFDRSNAFFRRFEAGRLLDAGSVQVRNGDGMPQPKAFLDALDAVQPGKRDVVLVLPPDQVLQKSLTLPLATEENLRQVLEFQVEELTPFTLPQIYFAHRITARSFERGQLSVDFIATPKDAADSALQLLNNWGASVRAVVTESMLSTGKLDSLLPADQVKPPSFLRQGLNPWITGLVLLLLLATLALPLAIKREAVVQMLPWVNRGKVAAETADSLRRSLETKVDDYNYLLEKRQAIAPVTVALEELTRVLPDDTYVQQLDIKGKELLIQGETASSVRLIGLFEKSSLFRDPGFRSSLTKGQAANTERYQLAVQVRRVLVTAPAPLPQMPASSASAPAPAAAKQP